MFAANLIEKKAGYSVIRHALPSNMCELITEYVRLKAQIKPRRSRSTAVLNQVHREYGDPLMETLLSQLTPVVEQALERALWPTLSFCYLYAHGNQLLKHTDRSSCQWVAGLCLGADAEFTAQGSSWPLQLTINGQTEIVNLAYGDLIIFAGHTTEHWREAFSGHWFVSAIFGFVEQDGPFAFQKFDQRSALGQPHVGMFRWALGSLFARTFRQF
jgi:hypothetical protein